MYLNAIISSFLKKESYITKRKIEGTTARSLSIQELVKNDTR
jgi:hypothetical protein